jgi:hypothetical protein
LSRFPALALAQPRAVGVSLSHESLLYTGCILARNANLP